MTRSRNTLQIVLGAIAVVWGAALLVRFLLTTGAPQAVGAYQAGQTAAVVFGILLLLVGARAVYKATR